MAQDDRARQPGEFPRRNQRIPYVAAGGVVPDLQPPLLVIRQDMLIVLVLLSPAPSHVPCRAGLPGLAYAGNTEALGQCHHRLR